MGLQGVEAQVVAKALELGASAAGIARVVDLRDAPSYGVAEEAAQATWPPGMSSVLVWALEHPSTQPSLDWWNYEVPGHTPGNRAMVEQAAGLRDWLAEDLGIEALPLPYRVERGGVFLKDAAVLAGLGMIGRHNLLITPGFGTRIRLRAMFLARDLMPTGPATGFDPCDGCPAPCHRACPRDAFEGGDYVRPRCEEEMEANEAAAAPVEGALLGIEGTFETTKYCRNCELACPAGVLRST